MLSVIPLGLEPKTHSLEGCCSIQLSYGTFSPGKGWHGVLPFLSACKGTNFFAYCQKNCKKSRSGHSGSCKELPDTEE